MTTKLNNGNVKMPEIWKKARKALHKELKPGEYANWIRPIRAWSITALNEIHLLFTDFASLNYVKSNFSQQIEEQLNLLGTGEKSLKIKYLIIDPDTEESLGKVDTDELNYAVSVGEVRPEVNKKNKKKKTKRKAKENKALAEIKKERTHQMTIFEVMPPCRKREEELVVYANGISLWDSVPKYVRGRKRISRDKMLPTIQRRFKYQDKAYMVDIVPARVIVKKGEEIIDEYEAYPGSKEEFIEDALRKMATAPDRIRLMDQYAGIEFTLQELRKELKDLGHTYSIKEIKAGLQICARVGIDICRTGKDSEAVAYENIFAGMSLTSRKQFSELKGKDKCYVQFSRLVTGAIQNRCYRLYDYKTCMLYRYDFSRYLHKRLALRFVQADTTNNYSILMTTLVVEGGFTLFKSMGDTLKKTVIPALDELKAQGVLRHYSDPTPIYNEKRKNKIDDYELILFPGKNFIDDQILSHSHSRSIKEVDVEKS